MNLRMTQKYQTPIDDHLGRKKIKSKQIVVEERNENNEIVRQIIDKSKKRKVTALKKAIMRKREIEEQRKLAKIEKEKLQKKVSKQLDKDDELSSGYVTVEESLVKNDEEVEEKELIEDQP